MLEVTSAERALIEAGKVPSFRAVITYAGGTSETLSASRFLSGSPVVKLGISADGIFTVGGAVIGSFNFSLMNDDGHFDSVSFPGAQIIPQVSVDTVWHSLGIFHLASHKTAGTVIMCTAYDSLALLDEAEFVSTWPVTFLQAAQAVCTRHGLTLASTSFTGANMEFEKPEEAMTDRMALAYMAQCTGNHVRMNAAGQLLIARSTGNSKTVSSVFDANLHTSVLEYTGVRITPYGSDTASLYGAEGNVLSICDNLLITDDNALAVGAMLWGNGGFLPSVNAAGYTAGDADILSDFTIEPGDVLSINGKSFLVTNLTYKPGVREKVACDAEDPMSNDMRTSKTETLVSAVSTARNTAMLAAQAAVSAQNSADAAQSSADDAATAAQSAQSSADAAGTAAASAQTSADNAMTAATTANTAASSALTQLSVVEDVVDVLNWVSEHGSYKLTADTTVVEGKYYFTRSGTSPNYTYTVVTNPTGNPKTKGYYELDSVDEAVSNYIISHLALTNQGLWVINDNSAYKILLANDGMKVYDGSGNLVSSFGESIIFSSTRPQTIGNESSYVKFYKDGNAWKIAVVADSISLGSNVVATETYADGKASAAESSAKIYADGKASTAELNAKTYADGVAGTAESNAKAYADTAAGVANAKEQLIYISKATGTTSVPANTTWVTNVTGNQNVWTTKRPEYSKSYPVLFVATQRQTVSQTSGTACACTTPMIDDTTTVIDGGNIITGTVTANKLNAADINASKTLTIGAFQEDTQEDILNSNVQIGGRNLLLKTAEAHTSAGSESGNVYITSYAQSDYLASQTLVVDETILTLSFDYEVVNNSAADAVIWPHFHGNMPTVANTIASNANRPETNKVYMYVNDNPSGHYWVTFKVSTAQLSGSTNINRVRLRYATDGATLKISNMKLEFGNKATGWSPAPEDVDANIEEASKNATNYIVADSTGLMVADMSGGAQTPSTATTNNVLIDSDSVDIRNGQTTLASFSANKIELGKGNRNASIEFCEGHGSINYISHSYDDSGDVHVASDDRLILSGADDVLLDGWGGYIGVSAEPPTMFPERQEGHLFICFEDIEIYNKNETIFNTYTTADVTNAIPVTLYNKGNAAANESVTLSETAANFKRLTIFFKDTDNNYSSVDVWSPNGKRVSLSLTWINGASTQEMYQRVRWVTISGTTISTYRASASEKYRTGQVKLGATASVTNSDYIAIVHVVGYR